MLSFVFADINGKETKVENPVSMKVDMEQGVPADSLEATFPLFICDELVSIRVFDESCVVFTGIVDEQLRMSDHNGEYLKVVARSMAATLLDNESVPISYRNPSVSVIESRHTKPFSVSISSDSDDTYFGTQTVLKGSTNWQAVEDFAKNTYGTVPRVNECGELNLKGIQNDKTVVFSNSGDGIAYSSFSENIKRCEEISKVKIKVTNSCGYNSIVENEDAVSRCIQRERYLNAVLTDTPAVYAENMIKNGRAKSYVVTLCCPGQHLSVFGCDACVRGSVCADIDLLYVSSLRYSLSSGKDTTTVTLKRKEV